jgi:hypothetical protein
VSYFYSGGGVAVPLLPPAPEPVREDSVEVHEEVEEERQDEPGWRAWLSDEERAARELTLPHTPERQSALLPRLPRPTPELVKRVEEAVAPPPPPKVPAPGTQGALCRAAHHDAHYDPKAQRHRCRTCDAARWRKTHGKGKP